MDSNWYRDWQIVCTPSKLVFIVMMMIINVITVF